VKSNSSGTHLFRFLPSLTDFPSLSWLSLLPFCLLLIYYFQASQRHERLTLRGSGRVFDDASGEMEMYDLCI
jgi:hypothetical protein